MAESDSAGPPPGRGAADVGLEIVGVWQTPVVDVGIAWNRTIDVKEDA